MRIDDIPLKMLHVHVPKCAGNSFIHFLKTLFGVDSVLIDNAFMGAYPGIDPWINVIHGHFSAFKYSVMFNGIINVPMFTTLRNPVDRLVSTYFFLKDSDFKDTPYISALRDGKVTLEQFAQRSYFQNWISLYVPLESLALFERIFFVDQLEDAADYLSSQFGFDNTIYTFPKLAVTPFGPNDGFEISDKLRADLERLNSKDMVVYSKARELWA